jgi:hypothetical protein
MSIPNASNLNYDILNGLQTDSCAISGQFRQGFDFSAYRPLALRINKLATWSCNAELQPKGHARLDATRVTPFELSFHPKSYLSPQPSGRKRRNRKPQRMGCQRDDPSPSLHRNTQI